MTMAKKPETAAIAVNIQAPDVRTVTIPIIGESRLVIHKWSEKAKQEMRDKQQGKHRGKKAPKDPEAEFQGSLYQSEEGWYGFPAGGFAKAAVGACRYCEGVTMVLARGIIHVAPDGFDKGDGTELVRIEGDGPHMREDMVRIAMGTADLRYRGEFRTWRAMVPVRFNANLVTVEQLLNLFTLAGLHVGIGEGRPGAPKNSMGWGLFRVADGSEVEEVRA